MRKYGPVLYDASLAEVGKRYEFAQSFHDLTHGVTEDGWFVKCESDSEAPFCYQGDDGFLLCAQFAREIVFDGTEYKPFDFNDEAVRMSLLGAKVKRDSYCPRLSIITDFVFCDDEWYAVTYGDCREAEELRNEWVFAETGKPVGVEVEE